MFKTLQNALKVPEVRKRLLFTLLMLVVVRFGSQLPAPGVNVDFFKNMMGLENSALSFFDAFTGGSFSRMSIFALNINPYITASIIIQLLTIAFPTLEEMQKDGEEGRKKINKITRYAAIGLALLEAAAMTIGFGRQGLIANMNFANATMVVLGLTAGSSFLVWLGDRITEHGLGNGISMILLFNILSRVPQDFVNLYRQFIASNIPGKIHFAILSAIVIIGVILFTVIFVIILNDGERRIPVQYSKKMQGRKLYGGQSSHIPLKVNTAGVIPVIFVSSILQTPLIVLSFIGKNPTSKVGVFLMKVVNQQNWFNLKDFLPTIGVIIYIALLMFFAYFYTNITFNPIEVADNIKKQGGFINGIRPGRPTVDYLNRILKFIIFIGAIGLSVIALIPIVMNGLFAASVTFAGTSIIIIVGVILETVKQMESMMAVRHHKGFLDF